MSPHLGFKEINLARLAQLTLRPSQSSSILGLPAAALAQLPGQMSLEVLPAVSVGRGHPSSARRNGAQWDLYQMPVSRDLIFPLLLMFSCEDFFESWIFFGGVFLGREGRE